MRQNLIYDIGLHLGTDSEFYLKKGFNVVGVEADPAIAAKAADRLKAYVDAGRLTIVNKAIAHDQGPITFFVSDVSENSTTDPKWAERNRSLGASISEITVPGIPFYRLLEEYGVPYYLKIDIERADTLCLEGLLASVDRPKYVSLESSKISFDDVVNEFCLLQRLGYRKYKIVAQHRVEKQRLPNPAREGQFVDHVFTHGSSGAFGRELPGEWISPEQALKVYMRIFRKYRILADLSLSSFSLSRFIREAEESPRGPIASAAALARKMLPYVRRVKLLQSVKAKMSAGWYDTHAMLEE
jgi:FkbM family methyltransferase